MTLQLTDSFLEGIGLGNISDAQKETLKAELLATLELRIVEQLAHELTDEQVDEFNRMKVDEDASPEAAMKWLFAHVPNYQDIIADEMEGLQNDLRGSMQAIFGDTSAKDSVS